MNRFNFGSEICRRAAIAAGGRRASQHSCKSSSSAEEGIHCLKVRGIAIDPDLEMNSPFLDAARWDAEVAKMIKAFGAPIDPANAKTIGAYLKQNYGE